MTTPTTTPADGELEPLTCPHCRTPKTRNPHPNAGKPEHLSEAGYLYECIACLARTRNAWATRALAAEKRLTELESATPSPGKAPGPVAWLFECQGNGKRIEYASVDENDTNHWPLDQWTQVSKTPLYASPGKAEAERWQPIETAPKDGTEIWAFNGEQARMKWSEGEEWALWCWADEHLSDVDPNPEQPTHWMPLPAAPRGAIQQERDSRRASES